MIVKFSSLSHGNVPTMTRKLLHCIFAPDQFFGFPNYLFDIPHSFLEILKCNKSNINQYALTLTHCIMQHQYCFFAMKKCTMCPAELLTSSVHWGCTQRVEAEAAVLLVAPNPAEKSHCKVHKPPLTINYTVN